MRRNQNNSTSGGGGIAARVRYPFGYITRPMKTEKRSSGLLERAYARLEPVFARKRWILAAAMLLASLALKTASLVPIITLDPPDNASGERQAPGLPPSSRGRFLFSDPRDHVDPCQPTVPIEIVQLVMLQGASTVRAVFAVAVVSGAARPSGAPAHRQVSGAARTPLRGCLIAA